MFDPEVTLARASGAIIILEHCVRQCREAKDLETARLLCNKILTLASNVRHMQVVVRRMERGDFENE